MQRVTPDVRAPSRFVVVSFWRPSNARLQPFLVITGDTLVALRKRYELFPADDIVAVLERLVAGAAIDFLQNSVRRRLSVCQDDFGGRGQALGFVSFERGNWIGAGDKCVRERAAIEYGLRRSVRTARIHRMRGIAEKRQPT